MGPASWSEEGLAKLIDSGMNVARFNFSHGSHEDHQKVFDRLQKVCPVLLGLEFLKMVMQ